MSISKKRINPFFYFGVDGAKISTNAKITFHCFWLAYAFLCKTL